MAEATTYNSLLSDMRGYLDRGGIQDSSVYNELPRFVMLAQKRLVKEAPKLVSTVVLTSTMGIGEPIIAKPARWRETLSWNIGTGVGFNKRKTVYFRTYEFLRMYHPDPTVLSASKPPLYYADYNFENWIVGPTPAQAYPFEVIIIEEPAELDDSNQINIYTKKAPDLLLHACLLEAAVFVRNASMKDVEQAHYDRLVAGYATENKDQKTDASADSGVRK